MLPPAVLAAVRRRRADRLAELGDWLAIPSVSADPARAGDVTRAARWLATWQRSHGARVEVRPTRGGRDVVLGHWPAGRGAPLVVIYGHYDVQPPGPGWSSDPFTPVVRSGLLYARGADDDKGQLFAHLCALAAWRQAAVPRVQALVIAEGAEEVGSPGFDGVLRDVARRMRPRAVVVSDTERDADGTPTVTVSQRGHLAARLEVDTHGPEVHPGRFGGAVVDPGLVLAEALLVLRDVLLGEPTTLPVSPAAVRTRIRSDTAVARAAGGRSTIGPCLDERITRRGALSVTRLAAGGRGGAVPARSVAQIDLRLPPRAEPADVLRRVRRQLAALAPRGTTVRLRLLAHTRGVETMPDARTRRAAAEACLVGFGRPPTYLRSGGTVPPVGMMASAFSIRPLLLGLGTPGGNAHGPDEAMDLSGWAAGVDTSAALLDALGESNGADQLAVRPQKDHDEECQSVRSGVPRARRSRED